MDSENASSNLDARGRRKSSPSASQLYSHKIHNIPDPEGAFEDEINKLARQFSRAKRTGNISRTITLRERITAKCLKFFYITGSNVSTRSDFANSLLESNTGSQYSKESTEKLYQTESSIPQVDDFFIDALLDTLERYNSTEGVFTHMLRNKFGFKRLDAAYKAARMDTAFGGSNEGAPISLDAPVRQNDDGTLTFGDQVGEVDEEYGEGSNTRIDDEDGWSTTGAIEAFEERGMLNGNAPMASLVGMGSESDVILLTETISLITKFLESTGRAANDTRKLYTRMFFSETLTRITKLRDDDELPSLQRREKMLFGAVELPFQDTYTLSACRTIRELWLADFVEDVPPITRAVEDKEYGERIEYVYDWSLPATFYMDYLRSLGRPASDALVSQQRSNYEGLLSALGTTR